MSVFYHVKLYTCIVLYDMIVHTPNLRSCVSVWQAYLFFWGLQMDYLCYCVVKQLFVQKSETGVSRATLKHN